MSVCSVSTGSCGDFTISYQSQAQYAVWSDQQVNVLLTPNAGVAGDIYNVQVTSHGESGAGFMALAGNSQDQSAPATLVNARIFFAGGDVTGKTQTVIVGQQISLTGTPSGSLTSGWSWSIQGTPGQGGTYVGGYSNGMGGPPDGNNGQVDPVVTIQPSVTYYYTAAGTSVVQYSVTVNGKPYTGMTTFTVVAPTGSLQAVSLGPAGVVQGPCLGSSQLLCAQFGPGAENGMTFQFDYVVPSPYSGTFQYTQVGTTTASETYAATQQSTSYGPCPSGSMGVDDTFDYPFAPDSTNSADDSPNSRLPVVYSQKSRSDSFIMTVMFQPELPNAIFVPLSSASWLWSYQATSADGGSTWSLISGNASPPGPLPTSATATFPIYKGTLQGCLSTYGF